MKTKLMPILARIFWKRIITADITEESVTKVTSYLFRWVIYIYIYSIEQDSIKGFTWIDLKLIIFDEMTITETATASQLNK